FEKQPTWLCSVAASPDGRYVAAGGDDGRARLWDLQRPDDKPCRTFTAGSSRVKVAFAPDSRTLVCASRAGREPVPIGLWDVTAGTGRPVCELRVAVSSVALARDGRHLRAATADVTV